MSNLINFLQHKNVQLEKQLEKLLQRGNSPQEKLEVLLQQKHIQLEDHTLFLAFLAYLKEQQLHAQTVFKDVIKLPKHQFEAKYNMKWSQVVKLCVTFLTILRTNDAQSYKQFMD